MGIREKVRSTGNIYRNGDELIFYKVRSSGIYYVDINYQSSIVALLKSDGSFTEKYDYDPRGRRITSSGAYEADNITHLIDRGYCGHEHLPLLGLINMNARMYDPILGRFVSPDNYVQGATSVSAFNRYMYCRNNPVMFSDPSGNESVGASQIRYAISNSIQIAAEKLNNSSMLEDLNCRNRYLQIGMEDINLLAACMNLTPEGANQISEPQEIDNDKSQNVTDDCDDENNCENNSGQTEDAPNKPGLISLIVRNIKAIKLLAIAYNHYQIGGGKNNPLYLNSSDIDMSDFSMKDPEFKNVKKIGDIANIDFYKKNPDSGEALVIGKIDLRYEGNNRFSFMADEYNFNIEWKNGFSQRNIATFIDDYLHNGPTYGIIPYFFGGSYPIIIKGNVYIKP